MKGLKIFEHAEFRQVRTLTINGEPWFVGKDIAEALRSWRYPYLCELRRDYMRLQEFKFYVGMIATVYLKSGGSYTGKIVKSPLNKPDAVRIKYQVIDDKDDIVTYYGTPFYSSHVEKVDLIDG